MSTRVDYKLHCGYVIQAMDHLCNIGTKENGYSLGIYGLKIPGRYQGQWRGWLILYLLPVQCRMNI